MNSLICVSTITHQNVTNGIKSYSLIIFLYKCPITLLEIDTSGVYTGDRDIPTGG